MEFLVGGLAGAGAAFVSNPIDVIKTRMQLQGELRAHNKHVKLYKGVLHAVLVIVKTDGILALQRGCTAAVLTGFTLNSTRLGIYRYAEVHGWIQHNSGRYDVKKAFFWSVLGGYISAVASNPLFVIKTRIQTSAHHSIAVGKQYNYKGVCDAFATIYRTEGFRGYYVGINATCARVVAGSATQLTTFSSVKEMLTSHGYLVNSRFALAFVASAISGVVVALAMCPFDVCATRLQNQGTRGELYTGTIDCLYKTWKIEGLHGMFKGLGPLYLRIAPHTTLSLVIWDVLNDIIENKNLR